MPKTESLEALCLRARAHLTKRAAACERDYFDFFNDRKLQVDSWLFDLRHQMPTPMREAHIRAGCKEFLQQ